MSIRSRIVSALRVLLGSQRYAIIYDLYGKDGDDSEQYYGYFGDPEEALEMFETFRELSGVGEIHNAYLVSLERVLIPYRD